MIVGKDNLADEVLVVAAMLGDLGAFDLLAGRYRAAVVRQAAGMVGDKDAEDVVQEALLLAFRSLPSLDEPSRFAPWLRTITRHRALRWREGLKQDLVRVPLDEVVAGLPSLAPSAERRLSAHQQLSKAVAVLPEEITAVPGA